VRKKGKEEGGGARCWLAFFLKRGEKRTGRKGRGGPLLSMGEKRKGEEKKEKRERTEASRTLSPRGRGKWGKEKRKFNTLPHLSLL